MDLNPWSYMSLRDVLPPIRDPIVRVKAFPLLAADGIPFHATVWQVSDFTKESQPGKFE
jgi:hypothetical protein